MTTLKISWKILDLNRGCDKNCTYCAQAGKVPRRQIDPQKAGEQFEHMLNMGNLRINLGDDNFLHDKSWIEEFNQYLQETHTNEFLVYGAFADPVSIHRLVQQDDFEPFIKDTVKSGLHRMIVGLQGFHPEELKSMNRHPRSPEFVLEALPHLHKAGINPIQIDYIVGYPGFEDIYYSEIKPKILDFKREAFRITEGEVALRHHELMVYAPESQPVLFDKFGAEGILEAMNLTKGCRESGGYYPYAFSPHFYAGKFGRVGIDPRTGQYIFQTNTKAEGKEVLTDNNPDRLISRINDESKHPNQELRELVILIIKLYDLYNSDPSEMEEKINALLDERDS